MSWLYERLVRPALFTQDAETAHERTMHGLAMISQNDLLAEAVQSFCGAPYLPIDVFGLRFPNPVGLAGGMDKYGTALPAWQRLGFGFTELGAVTRHAQPGNPAPRVFRAIAEEAIVNRMGFNNEGAEALGKVLSNWRNAGKWPKHPVGVNLGKSKITPLESAAEDYAFSVRALSPHVDFFVVNVSSPNTPNLRQLQDKAALAEILRAISQAQVGLTNRTCNTQNPTSREVPGPKDQTKSTLADTGRLVRPVLVKVSPDLSFSALDDVLDLAVSQGLAGIVATNTTIGRPETDRPEIQKVYAETGGLSGAPLRARSTEVIRHIYHQTKGKLPIIGVGGIFNADHAWEKIRAGASLIQIYTGLVYKGPTVAKNIVQGLLQKLESHGAKSLAEAVGSM